MYDRSLVRIAEMRESARIIQQPIDGLLEGPWNTSDLKFVPPPQEELENSMESLVRPFKLLTEGYRPPVGEAYGAVEGSKAELGLCMIGDGSKHRYPWRERPSPQVNLKAIAAFAVGRLIADVIAIIGSRDIVLGEIDR